MDFQLDWIEFWILQFQKFGFKITLILNIGMNWKTYGFQFGPICWSVCWSFTTSKPFWLLRWCGVVCVCVGGGWEGISNLENYKTAWKRVEISSILALKSLGWLGGCIYDYSVSLSPNLWLMTFDLDLDLDLGLTISGCLNTP